MSDYICAVCNVDIPLHSLKMCDDCGGYCCSLCVHQCPECAAADVCVECHDENEWCKRCQEEANPVRDIKQKEVNHGN